LNYLEFAFKGKLEVLTNPCNLFYNRIFVVLAREG